MVGDGEYVERFLSPLANRRTDQWGGSLENRARLLLDIVRAVRAAVAPAFAVAVKLNSADFQRGGFDADDAATVIAMLAPLGVDVVELSGGSYEAPAMTGQASDQRTRSREAYFLSLAEELATTSPLPLMLTGGVVRLPVAEEILPAASISSAWAARWPSIPTCRTGGARTPAPRSSWHPCRSKTRPSRRPRAWPVCGNSFAASAPTGAHAPE
ncbi:hypothetical protein [Nocardia abscessus]|uniref:oxidoreductase n=1 Tax=Nocardia abscessus TaxID=120957 RepID=UPI003CC7EC3A